MATVLLTRSLEDTHKSRQRLEALGHEVLSAPVFTITPVTHAIPKPGQTLVVTSVNGVKYGLTDLEDRNWTIFCVGETTAQAARDLGFLKVFTGPGTAKGLMPLLLNSGGNVKRSFTYIAGEDVSYDITGSLRMAGFEATTTAVYRTMPASKLPPKVEKALDDGRITHVLFYSPRAATLFEEIIAVYDKQSWLAHLTAIGISSRIKDVLLGRWKNILCAMKPEERAIIDLIS